jgi:hypothetical protein
MRNINIKGTWVCPLSREPTAAPIQSDLRTSL